MGGQRVGPGRTDDQLAAGEVGPGTPMEDGEDLLARVRDAEEAAARSERRWRSLARSATERAAILDAEGTVVFTTSDGVSLGHGAWGAPTIAGRILDLLHPDDVDEVAKRIPDIGGTAGPSPPFLVRMQNGAGEWIWIEVSPDNQLHNPDVNGIIITTRDVHEREEAVRRLRDETRVLESLHSIGRRLAAELDLDTLLQEVTDAGTEVTDAAFGAFFHRAQGAQGDDYLVYAVTGAPREVVADFPLRAPGLFGPTFLGEGPVRIDDVWADRRLEAETPNPLAVRSFLGVPVVSRNGAVHGGLFFGHPDPGVFTERGERLAVGIAAHAAIAIDNARLYQSAQHEIEARRHAEAELAHQATHDSLTGLPNRILLRDRIGQALAHRPARGRAVAILLLDLDRFKVVNDSLVTR